MYTRAEMHCAFLGARSDQAHQATTYYLGEVDRIGRIDRTHRYLSLDWDWDKPLHYITRVDLRIT